MDRLISPNYKLKTFGCKVNTYDSGLLQQRFTKRGFQEGMASDGKLPQVHVLNTCAVTAEATQEAIREIRRIKRKNPNDVVVVTGCAAQVDKEKFEPLAEADLIVANSHKGQIEELILKRINGEDLPRVHHSNIFRKDDLEAGGGLEAEHTRSFLKIQDGCNSFCTYCVIPFARGKSRSISISNLVERVQQLYSEGAREVVLTGVHIGDFEDSESLGKKGFLEDLIESLLIFTRMPRFRLSSLEPIEVSDRLLSLYQDSRLCPHFHMSIQSANTKVLSQMKRKYTAEDVERSLTALQQKVPGSYVGMDVIVGFPGETEEEFLDTYARLERSPWTRMHVFPYSARPGTKAATRTDSVPEHLIRARAQRLKSLSLMRVAAMADRQVGTTKLAMILQKPSRGAQGLTRDYWPVQIEGFDLLSIASGEEVAVEIVTVQNPRPGQVDRVLVGKPIPAPLVEEKRQ